MSHYDLDVRVDDGDWERLLSDTQSTNYQYTADYAHRYTFRVTATDNSGNAGQGEADATTANAVTKYYYFGGKRVAMRGPDATVQWLHGDHLGSTSLATDAAGEALSRQLYYPFGEVRWASESPLPTDFQFTGQRNAGTIGLYDYRARFYDPYLGRFISADTIIPNPANPQHFNRYSYVGNNPLAFTDPSGHGSRSAVILGGGEASSDDLAQYQTYRTRLDVAQQACIEYGLGAGCYFYEGAIWHNYFTGSALGAAQYRNATGAAAGDEGAYRAAVAREWSAFAFSRGLIDGDTNLNYWQYAEAATIEQRAFITLFLSYGSGAIANGSLLTYESLRAPSFSATGLGGDIYPIPDLEIALTNQETRLWYYEQVKKINTNVPPTRENAERLHAQRNALKAMARALMADRAEAARLDRDRPLQSFEYYVQKYSAKYSGEALWYRIIHGTTTTNLTYDTKYGVR